MKYEIREYKICLYCEEEFFRKNESNGAWIRKQTCDAHCNAQRNRLRMKLRQQGKPMKIDHASNVIRWKRVKVVGEQVNISPLDVFLYGRIA